MSGDVVVKNAHKYLKIITILSLSFYLSSLCFTQPAIADTTPVFVNINSSNSIDTTSLSQMTLDQLKAAAQPMINNLLNAIITGDTSNIDEKLTQYVSQNGNIYYTTNTIIIPSSGIQKITVSNITTYDKFLGMTPGTYPHVNIYLYYWQFKDGVLQSKDISIKDITSETLYKQASVGFSYPSTIASTYSHKRLSTMFDMANEINPVKLDNAIITTGTTFADSLSGTVLSSKLGAPILFMNTESDTKVYEYISSHVKKGGTIYVLGSEGAVGADIANRFTQDGYVIRRLGGLTRYDTCQEINSKLNTVEGSPVIVASGEDFPDALSISSVAAIKGYPILLTKYNNIPEQTLNQLKKIKPSKIYVIGGSAVISDITANALKSYSSDVTRIYGADRYETSLNICKTFKLSNNLTIAIATGTNFKDALAGSTVAAKNNIPILLVNKDVAKVKQYLDTNQYRNLIILGDTEAVSSDIENTLAK